MALVRLNRRGIFHPGFPSAVGRVDEGAMTVSVLIRRPTDADERGSFFDQGGRKSGMTKLCTARARVQPSADYQAKGYDFGNVTTAFQSVKIDIPMVERVWLADDLEQLIKIGDQVVIQEVFWPHLEPIKEWVYTVRNPQMSSNAPQWNLLCDADLKSDSS